MRRRVVWAVAPALLAALAASGSAQTMGTSVGYGATTAGATSSVGTGGISAGAAGGNGLTSAINTSATAPTLTAGTLGNQSTISATVTGGPAASGAASSLSSGVSTANVFFANFNNPLAGGLTANATGGGRFGAPLFGTTTTQTSAAGPVSVSIVGSSLGTNATYGGGIGLGTGTNVAGPTPARAPDFTPRGSGPTRLQTELRQVLARSSALTRANRIEVVVNGGGTVVLRGRVANERERVLAENLLWLTPGVSEIRNELTVR